MGKGGGAMKQTITELDHAIYRLRHLCVEDISAKLCTSIDTVRVKLLKAGVTPHHRNGIPVIMGSKTAAYYEDEMEYGSVPSYNYEEVKGELE
jgi:hypothetical protein